MEFINWLLGSTQRTLGFCALVLLFGLIVQGTLMDYVSMRETSSSLSDQLTRIELASDSLKGKLEKIKDPRFIEMQIKERFDYAEEGDLVFIFSKE